MTSSSFSRIGLSFLTQIRYSGSYFICFKPSKVKSALTQEYFVLMNEHLKIEVMA